jgi:hypothetical protein
MSIAGQLFLQNVIAIIWDFDKTLIPGYMQSPLVRHFGVDENRFWDEVNALPEEYRKRGTYRASKDSVYLNHILTYVQAGIFSGLTNSLLRKLGAELEFYPGLPEFFETAQKEVCNKREYVRHEITVEHYIVSTGLRAMIEGSQIPQACWTRGRRILRPNLSGGYPQAIRPLWKDHLPVGRPGTARVARLGGLPKRHRCHP